MHLHRDATRGFESSRAMMSRRRLSGVEVVLREVGGRQGKDFSPNGIKVQRETG